MILLSSLPLAVTCIYETLYVSNTTKFGSVGEVFVTFFG